jgi:hypothetical protein
MWGKSDFSLRHKLEDDFSSLGLDIIGADDLFAFAC